MARAKVTANRVAVVVANEWKDANDKVMPVKQWLEERRFLQVILLCSTLLIQLDLVVERLLLPTFFFSFLFFFVINFTAFVFT